MMTKAYNIIDYQLDRESSKCHQSVIKKINDDNKDNRINIEEYSIKGSMFIINQINISLILIKISGIFSNFFSPTANSHASTNRSRPMEAEVINTPSTTIAPMKLNDLRKGRKTNYDDAKLSITKPPTRQTELMKTQTPNPRTTPHQTSNTLTAEGKMKAPTGMPELSLQDVFSDSAKLAGVHQKTLSMFANEHGKRGATSKRKMQKEA